jgi:hypothetical protein
MTFDLLTAFESLFRGKPYYHRRANQGDAVAAEFYEDLHALGLSPKLRAAIDDGAKGIGPRNKSVTLKRMRRGDGTFGHFVDPRKARVFPGHAVRRGGLATIDIGIEVKILNKAMQKQIDRVVGDLDKQVRQWRRHNKTGKLISVAVVGINHADYTVGYEGPGRSFRTDGGRYPHPVQEAPKAEKRIVDEIVSPDVYDEVVILRFRARNEPPFDFGWVDPAGTAAAYTAVLKRIAALYEARF